MIKDGKKYCKCCDTWKTVDNFFKASKRKDSLSWECKPCAKIARKIYLKRVREEIAVGARIRTPRKNRRAYVASIERDLLRYAKHRANIKELEFDITLEDIVIPELCPVLGIPLFRVGGAATDNSPSLDRCDPTKGYIKGNVNVISMKANRVKCNATIDEVTKILTYMRSET